MKQLYRPLPDTLKIQDSPIEGVGLFAVEFIPAQTNLGVSHHFIDEHLIRTPLGGFYNHSNDPTCYSVIHSLGGNMDGYVELVTLTDIEPGEEITTYYSVNPLNEYGN